MASRKRPKSSRASKSRGAPVPSPERLARKLTTWKFIIFEVCVFLVFLAVLAKVLYLELHGLFGH